MDSLAFLRPLGLSWIALGSFMIAASLLALVFSLMAAAVAYAVTALLPLLVGGVVALATSQSGTRTRGADVSAFVALAWAISPLFAAPAFALLVPEFTAMDSIFEAYSALTTTGAILVPPADAGREVVLWRCMMSFAGGFGTLVFAAGLLAVLDRGAQQLRKTILLTVDQDNVFSHLHIAAQRIFVVYALLTLICFVLLLITGVPAFDALCLSLSALSTGGYSPVGGPLTLHYPAMATVILCGACLIASTNIAVLWTLNRGHDWRPDPEMIGFFGLLFALWGISMVSVDAAQPFSTLAETIFAITTAGFTASADSGFLPVAALFVALVGGSAASTTGGIKVSRFVLLWRQIFTDLGRLPHPSSVLNMRYRNKDARSGGFTALWTTVLAFVATVTISTVIGSALGDGFEQGWTASMAAIANAGPLFDRAEGGQSWAVFSTPNQILFIVVMVLGRLEIMAGAAALLAILRKD